MNDIEDRWTTLTPEYQERIKKAVIGRVSIPEGVAEQILQFLGPDATLHVVWVDGSAGAMTYYAVGHDERGYVRCLRMWEGWPLGKWFCSVDSEMVVRIDDDDDETASSW